MSLSETLPPAAPAATAGASALPTDCRPAAAAPLWVAVGALAVAGAVALLFTDRFRELYALWTTDDNYSHGFLVPIVSAYLAWGVFRRQGLTEDGSLRAGLLWVGVGCVLHLWAVVIWWPPVDFLALATLLYGFAVLAGGRRWAQAFLFPILFLFFMFPLSPVLLNEAAVWLQGKVAVAATWLLQFFVPAYHVGSRIFLPGHVLEVGDQCSGLRQIVAFAALTLLVAYLSNRRLPFRVGIVLAGAPVAIAANLLRVLLMALLTLHFGPESISEKKVVAFGVSYHTAWGLLTMAAGLGLLLAVAWWLGRVFPNRPDDEAPADSAAPEAPVTPAPLASSRALGGRLGGAFVCLAAALAVQWGMQGHLASGQEVVAAATYINPPLQGSTGFPVSLGAWSVLKEATPKPATRPTSSFQEQYFREAHDKLNRAYVRTEEPERGLQCQLWMVHYRDGRDRHHHPIVCYKVDGCNEYRDGYTEVELEGEGAPARRFAFTRDDDASYVSYVYYWHYRFRPAEDALSPLQSLHAGWSVRPSLTVEVFTTARTPQQLDQAAEFVRLVDGELKSHLPPGARRGSEALPISAR